MTGDLSAGICGIGRLAQAPSCVGRGRSLVAARQARSATRQGELANSEWELAFVSGCGAFRLSTVLGRSFVGTSSSEAGVEPYTADSAMRVVCPRMALSGVPGRTVRADRQGSHVCFRAPSIVDFVAHGSPWICTRRGETCRALVLVSSFPKVRRGVAEPAVDHIVSVLSPLGVRGASREVVHCISLPRAPSSSGMCRRFSLIGSCCLCCVCVCVCIVVHPQPKVLLLRDALFVTPSRLAVPSPFLLGVLPVGQWASSGRQACRVSTLCARPC